MIPEVLRIIIPKGMEFNEKHARLFYRLLNHRHFTELRFLKREHYPAYKIVKNEEEFIKACITWNGKRNIYAGIRDRVQGRRNCATATDIIGLQTIILDIDPIREGRLPSSDEELRRSIEVSEEISECFEEKGFKKPYTAVTGNGTSLYFSTPFLEITPQNGEKISFGLQLFEEEIRKPLRDF